MFAAANHQKKKKKKFLKLECQKKNEENDQLKNCEPEDATCVSKIVVTCEYHTKNQQKLGDLERSLEEALMP